MVWVRCRQKGNALNCNLIFSYREKNKPHPKQMSVYLKKHWVESNLDVNSIKDFHRLHPELEKADINWKVIKKQLAKKKKHLVLQILDTNNNKKIWLNEKENRKKMEATKLKKDLSKIKRKFEMFNTLPKILKSTLKMHQSMSKEVLEKATSKSKKKEIRKIRKEANDMIKNLKI